MTDYRTVYTEGALADLLDQASDKIGKTGITGPLGLAVSGAADFLRGKKSNSTIKGSIAKSSAALTAIFPVIVSRAIDIDKAVMISKAIERKAASMLQMLFAANQISDARGAQDYLSRFHNNIKKGELDYSDMNVDDVLAITADYAEATPQQEDVQLTAIEKKGIELVTEDVKHYKYRTYLPMDIESTPISDYSVVKLHEVSINTPNKRTVKSTTRKEYVKQTVDSKGNPVTKPAEFGAGADMHTKNVTIDSNDEFKDTWEDRKNAMDVMSKTLMQSDIKKANEAQPTMMIVNFTTQQQGRDIPIVHTCVIGVKAMIHYVSPEDIVNRVILKQSDKRGLFNLIRAATGEIAFFKDFIFAVNRAKVDAVARSGRGSSNKIWKLLELRADRLRGKKVTNQDQAAAAAISTLVISQAEVDHIKQHHRIDLSRVGTAKAIMNGYNLMALAIIDDINEKVDFLYDDGSTNFESLSFMSLEREEAGSMYKKIVNLAMKGR